MEAVFAHIVAFVVVAPLGMVAGATLGLLFLLVSRSPLLSFVHGAFSVWAAFSLAALLFAWLDVHMGWLAWLCLFLPMSLAQGTRVSGVAGAGVDDALKHEQAISAGMLLAFIAYGVGLLL